MVFVVCFIELVLEMLIFNVLIYVVVSEVNRVKCGSVDGSILVLWGGKGLGVVVCVNMVV